MAVAEVGALVVVVVVGMGAVEAAVVAEVRQPRHLSPLARRVRCCFCALLCLLRVCLCTRVRVLVAMCFLFGRVSFARLFDTGCTRARVADCFQARTAAGTVVAWAAAAAAVVAVVRRALTSRYPTTRWASSSASRA